MRIVTWVAAAAALLLGAPVALAHEGSPNFLSQINEVTPAARRRRRRGPQPRRPAAAAQRRRPAPCSIEGYDGEPYARIEPDGTVSVNTDSKAYYINEERDGQVAVPDGVDGKGEPQWEEVSRTGRFEWHDHRMHWMSEDDPEEVKDKDVRTKIYDWKVPIAVDGRAGRSPARCSGRRVPSSGPPLPLIIAFARARHPARDRRGGRAPAPPRGRRARRGGLVIRALALALAALALLPATASAHALLKATTPERGARLDAAPEQVSLRFSEPVEAEFGAVRVFDSEGREVQAGRTFHPERPRRGGRRPPARRARRGRLHGHLPRHLGRLAPGLRRLRVRGRRRARARPPRSASCSATTTPAPVTGTAFGVARAVQFGAIALGLGAVIFALLCWLPGLRATAGAGAGWQAASTAFSARLRAAAARRGGRRRAVGGGSRSCSRARSRAAPAIGEALSADVIGDVLGTRFGVVLGARRRRLAAGRRAGRGAAPRARAAAGGGRRDRARAPAHDAARRAGRPAAGARRAARARRPRERAVAGRAADCPPTCCT